jgi:CheY-like chemotaxis protein
VAPALDRAEGGLGIGLALSRGLVALHGGRIEVHSAGLGQGSEFTVRLPLQEAEAAARPDEPAAAAAASPVSVLIADDNADARDSLAALLEIAGHKVHAAPDGEQALALAAQHRPDVAILDIGMPLLNGYDVAARIRASEWGRRMRLIALTGWGQAADQERARQVGFDHHVTKPLDVERLQGLIAPAAA